MRTDMLDPMGKDVTIALRVSPEEQDQWSKAAAADGRSLSDWIRRRCNGLDTAPLAKATKKGGKQ